MRIGGSLAPWEPRRSRYRGRVPSEGCRFAVPPRRLHGWSETDPHSTASAQDRSSPRAPPVQQGPRVREHDEATCRGTEHPRRRHAPTTPPAGRHDTAEHEPRRRCSSADPPATGERNRDCRERDEELGRVHRTDHLAWFQPPGRQQSRGGDRSPAPTSPASTNPATRPSGPSSGAGTPAPTSAPGLEEREADQHVQPSNNSTRVVRPRTPWEARSARRPRRRTAPGAARMPTVRQSMLRKRHGPPPRPAVPTSAR